jgi:hypothetical protein
MELAFAALHQLCAPMLDRLERLPVPQRDALRTTFGMSAGPVPDRFWSAWPSWACCRRWLQPGRWCAWSMTNSGSIMPPHRSWRSWRAALGAESVGLVFGARVPSGDLSGLPELVVEGLREDHARALLGADRDAGRAGARSVHR